MSGRAITLAVAAVASVVAGCGGGSGASGDPSGGRAVVLAAASLTDAFTTLADRYEAEHPGVDIDLGFGSSTTLARQVSQGAPADLVALAGTGALAALPEQMRAAERRTIIAGNVLEIATPAGNPGRVAGLADLARGDLSVVLCVASAPCGAAADEVLRRAGVSAHVVSRELDVRATLAKVRLGEVDAAIVYHSDVVAAGSAVSGVAIPTAANAALVYPMVRISDSPVAAGFARYVAATAGRAVLLEEGFQAP